MFSIIPNGEERLATENISKHQYALTKSQITANKLCQKFFDFFFYVCILFRIRPTHIVFPQSFFRAFVLITFAQCGKFTMRSQHIYGIRIKWEIQFNWEHITSVAGKIQTLAHLLHSFTQFESDSTTNQYCVVEMQANMR